MQYLTEVICFLSFNKQKITVKKVFKPPKLTLSHFDNTGFSCQIRFKTCQYCHAIFGGRGMGEGGALLKVYQLKIMLQKAISIPFHGLGVTIHSSR